MRIWIIFLPQVLLVLSQQVTDLFWQALHFYTTYQLTIVIILKRRDSGSCEHKTPNEFRHSFDNLQG